MKRWMCLFMCLLMLPVWALAEEDVTEGVVFDAADSVGTVVNAESPEDASAAAMIRYAFTPLDVALVIDCSGSMADSDPANGRSLLDYAKLAAETFGNTLLNINPGSRIALAPFSSNGWVACGLTERADWETLRREIGRLGEGGGTNTGDGFRKATQVLQDSADGRQRVVVLITDGQANDMQDCIDQGFACAGEGAVVYTIGLVGRMSEGERRLTRQTLQAGYEAAYFEVEFDNVSDAGAQINQIANTIAMSASAADVTDENGNPVVVDVYELSLGEGFHARVTAPDGSRLSSHPEDYATSAPFGSMINLDGRKHFAFIGGNYVIEVVGCGMLRCSYTFKVLQGVDMRSRVAAYYDGWSHESLGWRITTLDGNVEVENISYDVLNPYELDHKGDPVVGLQQSVGAVLARKTNVLSAPASNAKKLGELSQKERVRILAEADGYYFISYVDDKSYLNRGWINASAIEQINGFIPCMYWLDGGYAIAANCTAHGAPEADSAAVMDVKAGANVTLKHVERSASGEEWAYVMLRQQTPTYGYVPVTALTGWQTIAPDAFRIGHDLPPFTDVLTFEPVWFQRGQTWKVFSAPNASSWRGARGKAEVSTNDVVYVCGWVNRSWLMVAYETNGGSMRVGYVDGKQIKGSYPDFPLIAFRHTSMKVKEGCTLTDDPIRSNAAIRTMYRNNAVTVYSSYVNGDGVTMYYVETTADSKTTRGFIPWNCLE